MGFLVSAGVFVDSVHEPPPSFWQRLGRPAALAYASWVYPQDQDPAKVQAFATPVVPPRRLPAPVQRDVGASRINPVVEDVQALMAWAGQAGVVPASRQALGPGLGRSQSDLIPVNVPATAAPTPGWDSNVTGGRSFPRPALIEASAYVPALAEAPALNEVAWAVATAVPPPRPPAARQSGQDVARPVAPPVDDLTSVLAPWRVDAVSTPRRPPAVQAQPGDMPAPALVSDQPLWLATFVQAQAPATRPTAKPGPNPGEALAWVGNETTQAQLSTAFPPPQIPPARPRPAAVPAQDPGFWAVADQAPPPHSCLWVQPGGPVAAPRGRDSGSPAAWDLTAIGPPAPWLSCEPAPVPRRLPAAGPWWQAEASPLPSPVANLVIIVGGPYSLGNSGVYVAGATVGEVLPL